MLKTRNKSDLEPISGAVLADGVHLFGNWFEAAAMAEDDVWPRHDGIVVQLICFFLCFPFSKTLATNTRWVVYQLSSSLSSSSSFLLFEKNGNVFLSGLRFFSGVSVLMFLSSIIKWI